jgi:hypothetical protein
VAGADDRNPHRDPRVIASWRGDVETVPAQATQLGAQLDELSARHGRGETAKRVWHGSLRAAPGDRVLGDAEWAEAAEQLVAANGLEGCRWVAMPTATITCTSPRSWSARKQTGKGRSIGPRVP